MGILDELLGDGRCAFAEGKRLEIFEKRPADAPVVEPVMGVESFIFDGDKGFRDLGGQVF